MPNNLPIEGLISDDATELLRVFHQPGGKGLKAFVRFEWWPHQPSSVLPVATNDDERNRNEIIGWAITITDLIGHVANYMQSKGVPVDVTIPRLFQMIQQDFQNGQHVTGETMRMPPKRKGKNRRKGR